MRNEIENLLTRVREAASGRKITIVAATKTVPPEKINLLPEYGIGIAGENRVQEFLSKHDSVHGIEWHFIGALQTNKVKQIVGNVSLIHSLDRERLADEIDIRSREKGIVSDVLIEINVGGEAAKSGVPPSEAEAFAEYVSRLKNIRLRGVMSVLPIDAKAEHYDMVANIGKIFSDRYGAEIISMGMSGDYETAIRHGANMIRVGSAIFGARNYEKR